MSRIDEDYTNWLNGQCEQESLEQDRAWDSAVSLILSRGLVIVTPEILKQGS